MPTISLRIDSQTEERLREIVKTLAERGPEPSTSQVVRYAIDELYERLHDGSDDARGSGSRDKGKRA